MEYYDKRPSLPGVRPNEEKHHLLAHGAITAGLIYRLDKTSATAAKEYFADTTKAGAAGANLTDQFVLALESGTTGQKLEFLFRGHGPVRMDGSGLTAGDDFTSDSSFKATSVADGDRVLGSCTVAGTADALITCWFDGTPVGLITDADT